MTLAGTLVTQLFMLGSRCKFRISVAASLLPRLCPNRLHSSMFVYGQKPYSSKSEIKPENIATDPMEVDPTPEEESQEEILEMLKQVRSSRLG